MGYKQSTATKAYLYHRHCGRLVTASGDHAANDAPFRALAAAVIVQAVRDLHKPEAYGATGENAALLRAGIRTDAERFFSSSWCAVIADGLGLSLDALRVQATLPEAYGRLRGAACSIGQTRCERSV